MGLFTNKKERIAELEEEVGGLKARLERSEEDRLAAEKASSANRIRMMEQVTEHEERIAGIRHSHKNELAGVQRELDVRDQNYEVDVEDGIVTAQNKLEAKSKAQDKEHLTRMTRLEKDYAEKIAKCDRNLETDKVSYRKYIRTENNKTIDSLTAENKKLVEEVALLTGENNGLTATVGIVQGQLDSMQTCFESIIGAMPSISAEFRTPDVNVVGLGGNKAEQKQEQKKQ